MRCGGAFTWLAMVLKIVLTLVVGFAVCGTALGAQTLTDQAGGNAGSNSPGSVALQNTPLGTGQADVVRPLRVAYHQTDASPPLVWYNQGEPRGYLADLLNRLATELGTTIEWVKIDDEQSLKAALESGRADLLPAVVLSPSTLREFELSEASVTAATAIFSRNDTPGIREIGDLRGKSVLAAQDSDLIARLRHAGAIVMPAASLGTAIDQVYSGEAEYLVGPLMMGRYETVRRSAIPLRDVTIQDNGKVWNRRFVCFAAASGNTALISRINAVMALMHRDGEIEELYMRWLNRFEPWPGPAASNRNVPPLRPKARSKATKLVFGLDPENLFGPMFVAGPPPATLSSPPSPPQGFAADVSLALGREIGVPVEFVVGNAGSLMEGIEFGEIDAIACATSNDIEIGRYDFTRPVFESPGMVVMLRGRKPVRDEATLAAMDVAVVQGSLGHQYLMMIGANRVIPCTSAEEALGLVARGEISAAMVVSFAYNYLLLQAKSGEYAGLQALPAPGQGFDRSFAFAVRAGNKSVLWDIEDAIRRLQASGELNSIHDRWLNAVAPRPRVAMIRWEFLWWVMGIVGALAIAVLVWQGALRAELARRTSALRAEQSRSAAIADNLPGLVFGYRVFADNRREILYCNNRLSEWQARFPQLKIGEACEVLATHVHPEERQAFLEQANESIHSLSRFQFELRLKAVDGSWRWVQFIITPAPDPLPPRTLGGVSMGKPDLAGRGSVVWHGTLIDVTVIRLLSDQLHASERSYRAVFEGSRDAIIIYRTADRRIVASNSAAALLYGYSGDELVSASMDLLASNPATIVALTSGLSQAADSLAAIHSASFRSKGAVLIPIEFTVASVDFDGTPAILSVHRDVTEREAVRAQQRRVETEMANSRRLEALGMMAGGIAHDFNNLLVGIMGNASVAKRLVDQPVKLERVLDDLTTAAGSAAKLTDQLLTFSAPNRYQRRALDIAGIADEIVRGLGSRVSDRATVRLDVEKELPKVLADPAQIRQLFLNLLANAADAVTPPQGVIRLSLAMRRCEPAKQPGLVFGASTSNGNFVVVEVADNGRGIDPAIIRRIFDPFYSTKTAGRGLGLATVARIVQGHDGWMSVVSAVGQGTTFRIGLAIAELPELGIVEPKAGGAAPAFEDGKSEAAIEHLRVLLVDDDDAVRNAVQRMLDYSGHTVEAVNCGQMAINACLPNAGNFDANSQGAAGPAGSGGAGGFKLEAAFDVILLDHTMPGLTGAQTLAALRAGGSQIPVIIMSGYAPHMVGNAGDRYRPEAYVAKPFDTAELNAALSEALAAGMGPTHQARTRNRNAD